ncbi:MAG: type II secretion system F family protein [Candidatus Niyogibacteria bacterium]|nr:type II secretion system F family protein [Candidatus Niyogibacteria bacterium]
MLFNYQARTPQGEIKSGNIDAASTEGALASLQRRNLIVISLESVEKSTPWYKRGITLFERVKMRDVVIISRQLSTLFEAKVPVVESLKVLVSETASPVLKKRLAAILEDIESGTSISEALGKYPEIFSKFYVNMVKSGEESGKLNEVFSYLADYLERSYDLTVKARNAFIYPAFVLTVFTVVMILMLVMVIPRLSTILTETGQSLPFYTKIIIAFSNFLRNFGILLLVFLAIGVIFLWRYLQTGAGKMAFSRFQLSIPIAGELYKKFYLARIADNLQTLLASGVPVVRALEITSDVVGNEVYAEILKETISMVKSGSPISEAFSRYEEVPLLISQSVKIGEETGKLDFILSTMARFYRREVDNAVDNIVSLIEPVMIVLLGLGVGVLVAAILVPIYNISTGF